MRENQPPPIDFCDEAELSRFAEGFLQACEDEDVDVADGLDDLARLLRTAVFPALIQKGLTEKRAKRLARENVNWEACPYGQRRKWAVIQGTARQRKKLKRMVAEELKDL